MSLERPSMGHSSASTMMRREADAGNVRLTLLYSEVTLGISSRNCTKNSFHPDSEAWSLKWSQFANTVTDLS